MGAAPSIMNESRGAQTQHRSALRSSVNPEKTMSREIEPVPLEDALDRQLAALTPQQLAALQGEVPQAGGRSLERRPEGHSIRRLHVFRSVGRSLRRLVKRA